MNLDFSDPCMFGISLDFIIPFILFLLVFIVVIVMFIVIAVKSIKRWDRNNRSPVVTVPAAIVYKRTNIHNHYNRGACITRIMTCYVTFQGTRYLKFERKLEG